MLRKILLAGAAVAACGFATGARAQAVAPTAEPQSGVQTVTVVARKRTENLQRVPAAVTAVSGQQLQQQNIRTALDLGRVAPGLIVSPGAQTTTTVVFDIRGQVSADTLLSIAPANALYEDTVNIPHPIATRASLFDLQQVEVLKGPQGTLYGRNSIGGAVNLLTRGADYNGFHGFIYGEGGDYNDWKLAGAVNAPIVPDVLAVRLAYQHWNRDGYGLNAYTGQHLGGDHDDDTLRLSVRFDPAPQFSSVSKLEYTSVRDNGQLWKATMEAPLFNFAPLCPSNTAPGSPFCSRGIDEAFYEHALNPSIPSPAYYPTVLGLPWNENAAGFNQYEHAQTWHAVEDWTWRISDDVQVRSISGFHYAAEFDKHSLDGTPWQLLDTGIGVGGTPIVTAPFPYPEPIAPSQDYYAFSQEVDLSGHFSHWLDWLIGGYGSWEYAHGGEDSTAAPATLESESVGLGMPPPNGGGPSEESAYAFIAKKLNTQTSAVYSQEDIHFTSWLSATLGARYTFEEQQSNILTFFYDEDSGLFHCRTPVPLGGPEMAGLANPSTCGVPSSEHSSGLSYLASLNFQVTPSDLIYLKTSRGFVGGGTQSRDPVDFPPYSPEFATDYEVGFKGDFFDHRLRTNLDAYYTMDTGAQDSGITTLLGPDNSFTLTTGIQNAASATIRGFEADVVAAPTPGWTIYGNASYNEGIWGQFNAILVQGGTANLKGQQFGTPNWQYSIGSRYEHDLGPGKLAGELDWAWHSNTVITPAQAPEDAIERSVLGNRPFEAGGLLNGRLDYSLPQQQLTLSFFMTNVLNRHWLTVDLPSEYGLPVTPQEPQMWGFSIRKAFGAE